MTWFERMSETLSAWSGSDGDIQAKLAPWIWTGEYVEREGSTCELCGQNNLVFQFEVANVKTGQTYWVGSSCVEMFDLCSLDYDGRVLDSAETINKVLSEKRRLARRRNSRKRKLH